MATDGCDIPKECVRLWNFMISVRKWRSLIYLWKKSTTLIIDNKDRTLFMGTER